MISILRYILKKMHFEILFNHFYVYNSDKKIVLNRSESLDDTLMNTHIGISSHTILVYIFYIHTKFNKISNTISKLAK